MMGEAGERMVQTTVGRKQVEESKRGSKGEKTGFTRVQLQDRCESDKFEKAERQ